MTLNEITTALAGRVGKELDLQYRQWLVPQVNTWRSRLIRNSLEKNPNERLYFTQAITIPLTYGPITCGGLVCNGSYSEIVPRLLHIGSMPFDYLGAVDRKSPYRYNDPGTSEYINAGSLASHFHSYDLDNGRIIIPDKRIPVVLGVSIFDEPEKAMEWECKATSADCDWFNAQYPVSGDILAMVKTAIWDELGVPREVRPKTIDMTTAPNE